jgi:hypothetical protein
MEMQAARLLYPPAATVTMAGVNDFFITDPMMDD